MKPLILFHANCADGFGAAFAAWLKLGDEAEYVPCSYGTPFLGDEWFNVEDREVYILDFSFPRIEMNFIFANAKRVVWLDHHKSAFEMWCDEERSYTKHEDKFHTIILDNNKSGAYLAWEWFHPDTEIPMLIQHIDDYDRWQFKLDGTKAFNKALWSYAPWSFEQWKGKFLPCDMGNPKASFEATAKYTFMINSGAAILRAHDQNVQAVVKGSARECEIEINVEGDKVRKALEFFSIDPDPKLIGLAANCPPHLTSDVGHELANQSGTFGLCWTLSQEGLTAKCSLRSNGEYDVSAIAKVFGGGGHRNAAGFEVPLETLTGWLKC